MKINHAPALSLFGFAFAFATPAVMAEEGHDHKAAGHEAHANHMLEGYLAVSAALYKDDLKAAKKAATGMVKHDKDSAMAKPAQAIADSKDIETARTNFKMLSAEAVKIAQAHEEGKYTVMNCPMVKGGGGDWLSADGKVNNPYFGPKMPHCGGPKK